ncbi:hypothetical protein ACWELP_24910 [Rhodococcus aetherivorans]
MDSSDGFLVGPLDGLLSKYSELREGQEADWEDASDLSRIHLQAFVRDRRGGFELSKSRGALRLTGDGVRGHSLDISDAGQILSEFQNLVTVTGAALQGQTSTRGRIRDDVVRRTRLALSASPSEGSVVLEFEPVEDEAQERYPKGETTVDGPAAPLVEQSVEAAIGVLGAAASSGLNVDEVHQLFASLGPRVAAATRALAGTAAKARLDLNLSWDRPGSGRKRVRASASDCATFASVLHGTGLDSEVVTLTGILRTISDRRKIDLETTDPENSDEVIVLAVDRGEVDLTPFHLGERVAMQATVTVTQRPGGSESRKYTAIYLSPFDESKVLSGRMK